MDRVDRVVERVGRIVVRRPDLVTLWREVTPILVSEVPHFEAPCFFTVDPECRIVTSHFQEGLPEIPTEWLAREYVEDDFNSMASVLASPAGIGTLHDATEGRPERSVKYHVEMQPFGCEQELVVALRTSDRAPWGSIGLYRETGQALFSEIEQRRARRGRPVARRRRAARAARRAGARARPPRGARGARAGRARRRLGDAVGQGLARGARRHGQSTRRPSYSRRPARSPPREGRTSRFGCAAQAAAGSPCTPVRWSTPRGGSRCRSSSMRPGRSTSSPC